jgi:hypothetical protein
MYGGEGARPISHIQINIDRRNTRPYTSNAKPVKRHAPRTILQALRTLPEGAVQRRDGLRCEPHVIDLSEFKFKWSIRALVFLGLVKETKIKGSLPWYRSLI